MKKELLDEHCARDIAEDSEPIPERDETDLDQLAGRRPKRKKRKPRAQEKPEPA